MFETLPEDIRRGLEAARKRAQRQHSRLCVHVNDAIFPILRLWETGLAVDARRVPPLRGLVDVYDGPRHVSQCLIIASQADGDETCYEFKRSTAITDLPVRDYADDDRPQAILLPRTI